MSDDEQRPIGTKAWFMGEARWTHRGLVHSCLRLLEQQEITRTHCVELLQYTFNTAGLTSPPKAPWEKLNWSGDAAPETEA